MGVSDNVLAMVVAQDPRCVGVTQVHACDADTVVSLPKAPYHPS